MGPFLFFMKRIALIGLGGIGVPTLLTLAESSEPLEVHIWEADLVEISNLPRQVIFNKNNIGQTKLDTLKDLVCEDPHRELFKNIILYFNSSRIDENGFPNLMNFDLVLDCTDDPRFKFSLNDFCKFNNIALVHAGAQGEMGFVCSVLPDSACLRCIFGNPDYESLEDICNSCRIGGVLSAYTGLTGAYMAELGLSVLRGELNSALGINIDQNGSREIHFSKSDLCPFCSYSKKLNLKNINCPETFLYTKLALQSRENSEQYLVCDLKDESDLMRVTQSVAEEGFLVKSSYINRYLGIYRLILA